MGITTLQREKKTAPSDRKLRHNLLSLQLDPFMQMDPDFVLYVRPSVELDDDQLFEFCQINRDFRIEQNEEGELIIMMPAGGTTSDRNSEINMQLRQWTKRDGTGTAYESSIGFRLGKKEVLSPDAAWVRNDRLAQLTPEQREKFPPLCPDFVIELKSRTDRLKTLQKKMQVWIDRGVQLGWLIDPPAKRVYIYRPQQPVATLEYPNSIAGDPILSGFVFDVTQIW